MVILRLQMGYDGLFFGRVDYQDKFNRALTKSMEMIWKGSPNNLGIRLIVEFLFQLMFDSDIFVHEHFDLPLFILYM